MARLIIFLLARFMHPFYECVGVVHRLCIRKATFQSLGCSRLWYRDQGEGEVGVASQVGWLCLFICLLPVLSLIHQTPTAVTDPAGFSHEYGVSGMHSFIHSFSNKTIKHGSLLHGETWMERRKQLWRALYNVLRELWFDLIFGFSSFGFFFICAFWYFLTVELGTSYLTSLWFSFLCVKWCTHR